MSFFVHESACVDPPCEIGEGTRIWHFSHVMAGARIGARCTLGQNVHVAGGAVIGDGVKIQNNVSVFDGVVVEDEVFLGPSCVLTNVTNPRAAISRRACYERTLLRRGATIGANATVVPGVTVGRHAFVAAGAVVTRDVPDYALVAGIPGRQVGWMSRHGHRLPDPATSGVVLCPESGLRYALEGGALRCLDLDEDAPLELPGAKMTPYNFALLGAAGFVAPRHFRAIQETGNRLLAACDPHDSVGVIDAFFPDASFFTEVERFDRFLEKIRRRPRAERVHYVSICSPNHLHDAHVRLALRVGASAICEKPLVINPWNLDPLAALERETQGRIYTVMQLRFLPSLVALRDALRGSPRVRDVELSYVTRRGRWYHVSWKGISEKSGGLAVNIGIHLFDLLLWLFGPARAAELHLAAPDRLGGYLDLERARVRWFLSVNVDDLPPAAARLGEPSYRSLLVDGQEIEFSGDFGGLHTRVYEHVLSGQGFGIEDARPSIELAALIRRSPVELCPDHAHPRVLALRGGPGRPAPPRPA